MAPAQAAGSSHAQPTEEIPFITSPDNVTLEMLNASGVKREELGSDFNCIHAYQASMSLGLI